jgi:hypothetical protein
MKKKKNMDFEDRYHYKLLKQIIFNYEERKVENTRINGAIIDTCMVTDSSCPYETGICHPDYNEGHYIIVELYETKEQSKIGHEKWVKLFSKDPLPTYMVDVNKSIICDIAKSVTGHDLNRIYKRNTKSQNSRK